MKIAEEKKCYLADLDIKTLKEIEPKITSDVFSVLSVESSVTSRNSFGGTSPSQVRVQIKKWREQLF